MRNIVTFILVTLRKNKGPAIVLRDKREMTALQR